MKTIALAREAPEGDPRRLVFRFAAGSRGVLRTLRPCPHFAHNFCGQGDFRDLGDLCLCSSGAVWYRPPVSRFESCRGHRRNTWSEAIFGQCRETLPMRCQCSSRRSGEFGCRTSFARRVKPGSPQPGLTCRAPVGHAALTMQLRGLPSAGRGRLTVEQDRHLGALLRGESIRCGVAGVSVMASSYRRRSASGCLLNFRAA